MKSWFKKHPKLAGLLAALAAAAALYYGVPPQYSQPVLDWVGLGQAEGADEAIFLPKAPEGTKLIEDEFLACPSGTFIFMHVWDIDPDGDKALVEYGLYEPNGPNDRHGAIFLVLVGSPDTWVAYVQYPDGKVKTYARSEMLAKYPKLCDLVDALYPKKASKAEACSL